MEKKWKISPRKYDELVDQLLFNRGIIGDKIDDKIKQRFFEPDFLRDLTDPHEMKNLEKAVLRIQKAEENKEKIGIFADYDADGIPGAALFYKALRKIGIDCLVYIPDREKGYGLSKDGLDYLKENGCTLIVTIDLGIRSLEEAKYARSIGLDLIITDHHLPGDEIPSAEIVINPKQKGDRYPDPNLCGCAVAFKLVQGLGKVFPKQIDEKFLKWNLDLVAISTISDVVPLTGENRLLAHYGLVVMKKTKNLGLSELIKLIEIKSESLGAYAVGFQIGPRINAPGRIDQASKSFDLLVTEDEIEAKELAKYLNEKNEERQAMMDETEREAIEYIEKNKLENEKIIVAVGKWQKGVIGPTASRLCEKYYRPIILFSDGGDVLTGSARSVSGVNIVDIFTEASEHILKFGGHSGAAGITVEKKNWKKFLAGLVSAGEKIDDGDLVKQIKIDAEVPLSQLSKKLYDKILQFEPFGMGNPRPTFVTEGIEIADHRFVGRDQNHLSAKVFDENHRYKMIHFSFPYEKTMIESKKKYDIAYGLGIDEWQGRSELSLNIIDIRNHK